MASTAPAPKPPSSSENGSPSRPCSSSLFQALLLQPPFSAMYFLRCSNSYDEPNRPSTLSLRSRCSSDKSKSMFCYSLRLSKFLVMPGLVPGIHVFLCAKAWMARSSPATTTHDLFVLPAQSGDPGIAGPFRYHSCRGVLGPRLPRVRMLVVFYSTNYHGL